MPYLTPAIVTDEELAMLKELKVKLKATSWKDLWVKLAQHYDGNPKHTLTKEEATELIKDLEKEKETDKEVIDTSEMEKFEARLKALETTPKEERSEPKMTKEDIIKHLETCTDPNCEYRMIAQAARDLERLKEKASEPDLSVGFLMVGDKTFTLDQIAAAKKYAMDFAKAHEDHVDIFYRKGNFKSKEFKSTMFGGFEADFKYGLEEALQDAKKFEKEEKNRLEEDQAKAKKEAKWLADLQKS